MKTLIKICIVISLLLSMNLLYYIYKPEPELKQYLNNI